MGLVFMVLVIGFGTPILLAVLLYLVCEFKLPGVIVIGLVTIALISVSSLSDVLFGAVLLSAIGGVLLPYVWTDE